MNLQKIYDDVDMLTVALYKQENVKEKLAQVLPQLQNIFLEIINGCPDRMAVVAAILKNFNEAVEVGDTVLLADLLKNEISQELQMYAQKTGCEIVEKNIREDETGTVQIEEQKEKNIRYMESAKNKIYQKVIAYCKDTNIDAAEDLMLDYDGNIAVKKENRWWRLNHYVNRTQAMQYELEELKQKSHISVLYVFGLGNLEYIYELKKSVSQDTIFLVYEPNPDIFILHMTYRNMRELFEDEKIFLFVESLNEEYLPELVKRLTNGISLKYTDTWLSPNYYALYGEKIANTIQMCNEICEVRAAVDFTIEVKAESLNRQRIKNMKLLYESVLLSDLKATLQETYDVASIPAIIIASGPSLDKNIQLLRKAKGKAFILATDSSLRMLDKYGLEPDAYVTTDADKEAVLFQNKIAETTPVFFCMHSTYDNIASLSGKKIFCSTEDVGGYITGELTQNIEMPIDGGGSVANTAFSIAEALGFQTIIAIGLDLAFLGDRKHAAVTYDELGVDEETAEHYTYVEGQNGETLLTYKNFMLYKTWYETRIKTRPLTLVDATEGGALIHGAVNMSFQDAIHKYCVKDIDMPAVIDACNIYFKDKANMNLREWREKCVQECEEVQNIYKKCIRLYCDLLQMKNEKQMQKKMEEINQLNAKAEKLFVMKIIKDYAHKETSNIVHRMYQQDAEKEQLKQTIKNGMDIAEVYVQKANKTKENMLQWICE